MRETTRTILTAVSVAAVMALLLPVGAHAAGQLMTIVDADSQAKAQVEDGRLRVGDGRGAMTVDGAVAARPALPVDPFSVTGVTSSQDLRSLGVGRIAITDLVLSHSNTDNVPTGVLVDLYRDGGNGDCTSFGAHLKVVLPYSINPANETLAIQLSTPVFVTARPVCLLIDTDSDPGLVFAYTVTGYRT